MVRKKDGFSGKPLTGIGSPLENSLMLTESERELAYRRMNWWANRKRWSLTQVVNIPGVLINVCLDRHNRKEKPLLAENKPLRRGYRRFLIGRKPWKYSNILYLPRRDGRAIAHIRRRGTHQTDFQLAD